MIVVDHIGGSTLSRFTLHSFALSDATEVFVFLGGFATATAYIGLAARHTEAAARQRFIWRSFEIYRAFLIAAALMLLISSALLAFSINAPNIVTSDIDALIEAPIDFLRDILLFRRQPYLASVLPMYVIFALTVPLLVPLACRMPLLLAAGSITLWLVSSLAVNWLPHADGTQWSFNPLAWQLLFVAGILAKCRVPYQRIGARLRGWPSTILATIVVVAALYYRLDVQTEPLDGSLKQNLAWFRVANFLAIAWIVTNIMQFGRIKIVACMLPWVCAVGRKGLLCFVSGSAISLIIDSILFKVTDGYLNYSLGLVADVIAISALFLVANGSERIMHQLRSQAKAPA